MLFWLPLMSINGKVRREDWVCRWKGEMSPLTEDRQNLQRLLRRPSVKSLRCLRGGFQDRAQNVHTNPPTTRDEPVVSQRLVPPSSPCCQMASRRLQRSEAMAGRPRLVISVLMWLIETTKKFTKEERPVHANPRQTIFSPSPGLGFHRRVEAATLLKGPLAQPTFLLFPEPPFSQSTFQKQHSHTRS